MPNTRPPFSSEYTKGTVTTSSEITSALHAGDATNIPIVSKQAAVIPQIDTIHYGTGKPRRIIIRGRISGG